MSWKLNDSKEFITINRLNINIKYIRTNIVKDDSYKYYNSSSRADNKSEIGDEIDYYEFEILNYDKDSVESYIKYNVDTNYTHIVPPKNVILNEFNYNKTAHTYDEENINCCAKWIQYYSERSILSKFKTSLYSIITLLLAFVSLNIINVFLKSFSDLYVMHFIYFVFCYAVIRLGIKYRKRQKAKQLGDIKIEILNFIRKKIDKKAHDVKRENIYELIFDNDFLDGGFRKDNINISELLD